jgi:hypothetical protein
MQRALRTPIACPVNASKESVSIPAKIFAEGIVPSVTMVPHVSFMEIVPAVPVMQYQKNVFRAQTASYLPLCLSPMSIVAGENVLAVRTRKNARETATADPGTVISLCLLDLARHLSVHLGSKR